MPATQIPEQIRWSMPPRNDCATECQRFIDERSRLLAIWKSAGDAEKARNLTESQISEAQAAIWGLNNLMISTWDCPGRMDLHQDDPTPCRHPEKLFKEDE